MRVRLRSTVGCSAKDWRGGAVCSGEAMARRCVLCGDGTSRGVLGDGRRRIYASWAAAAARVSRRAGTRVGCAAGVRAGRRARRCSSAMWRNSSEDCRPNRRAALSALCPAEFIIGFSPKLCAILENLIITNL